MFVDDILVFCDGTRQDIDNLDQGLKLLMFASGMVVNKDKSSIVMAHMNPMDFQLLLNYFSFSINHLDVGLKYLGFHIKPNDYLIKYWDWLIEKIERPITLWSHKWISRASRLVLIKSVLEAIMVYWAALSWIPIGILVKIQCICSSFLWHGIDKRKHLPWVSWDHISLPKYHGEWGLKNLFLFAKDLAAKIGWRLIATHSLGIEVITHKYIIPKTTLEWIRDPIKTHLGESIIWKELITSFDLIGDGLA